MYIYHIFFIYMGYIYLFELVFLFFWVFLDIYPGMELLGRVVVIFSVFWETSILFSTVTTPIYILTNSVWGFLLLHILANIYIQQMLIEPEACMSHEPPSGLILLYSSKERGQGVKKPIGHSLLRHAYRINNNNNIRILQFLMNKFLHVSRIRIMTYLDLLAC